MPDGIRRHLVGIILKMLVSVTALKYSVMVRAFS